MVVIDSIFFYLNRVLAFFTKCRGRDSNVFFVDAFPPSEEDTIPVLHEIHRLVNRIMYLFFKFFFRFLSK